MSRGRANDKKRCPDQEIEPTRVKWDDGGAEADIDLKDEIALRIKDDEAARDFYIRTREMAIRIATIAAFGKEMRWPSVDGETMLWAGKVAMWSTERMYEQFKEYAAETETQALAKEIVRHVKGVCRGKEKRMAHSHLLKRLDHRFKSNDIKGVIELLVVSGDIQIVQGPKGANGKVPVYYTI
jgi:hypothetical protein